MRHFVDGGCSHSISREGMDCYCIVWSDKFLELNFWSFGCSDNSMVPLLIRKWDMNIRISTDLIPFSAAIYEFIFTLAEQK